MTETATLDYSRLPQTSMPTDRYAIVMSAPRRRAVGVTDLVGNELDGDFDGSFPSGDGQPGGDFFEDLGLQTLQAPVITSFQMTTATDTGIPGDQNTNTSQPQFIGQVYNGFPGTVANLEVYVEFNGLHPELGGGFNLAVGGGGRGFCHQPLGCQRSSPTPRAQFTITLPSGVTLPRGLPARPRSWSWASPTSAPLPLPGLSSALQHAFRIDKTAPQITGASSPPGSPLASGPDAQLQPVLAEQPHAHRRRPGQPILLLPGHPQPQVLFPAIDPSTASNISNYSLIRAQEPRRHDDDGDESQFISSAAFVAAAPTLDASGTYRLATTARSPSRSRPDCRPAITSSSPHTKELQFPGLARRRGQPAGRQHRPRRGYQELHAQLRLQSQPVFITNLQMEHLNADDVRSPSSVARVVLRAPLDRTPTTCPRLGPAHALAFDLSNPMPIHGRPTPTRSSSSARPTRATAAADGNFGTLGEAGLGSSGTGFTVVAHDVVTLYNYDPAAKSSVPARPRREPAPAWS